MAQGTVAWKIRRFECTHLAAAEDGRTPSARYRSRSEITSSVLMPSATAQKKIHCPVCGAEAVSAFPECARPRAQHRGAFKWCETDPNRWAFERCCGRGRPHPVMTPPRRDPGQNFCGSRKLFVPGVRHSCLMRRPQKRIFPPRNPPDVPRILK